MEEVGVLPYLYFEMQPRESLKRVVNLGPFSHNVDDGVPLRKVRRVGCGSRVGRMPIAGCRSCAVVAGGSGVQAAFACIDSILEHLRERVGFSFLPRLAGGLRDDNADIQVPAVLVRCVGPRARLCFHPAVARLCAQMMCHQLVVKLCGWSVWQHHLLADLPHLVSSLETALRPPAKVGYPLRFPCVCVGDGV